MIVGIREFVAFIRNTRVENKIDVLVEQPCHMTVCQLCRVALGLARDGINSKLVDLARRLRGEYHGKTELLKESCPERVVLVHI